MSDIVHVTINALMQAMPAAQEMYRDEVKKELQTDLSQSVGNSDGKLAGWIEDVAESMESKAPFKEGDYIVGRVELPGDAGDNTYVRAMVLMHGNPGIGDPPMTKPGQETWDGNITEKSVHVLKDIPAKRMPGKFRHGNFISPEFMQNAAIKVEDDLSTYWQGVQADILSVISPMIKSKLGGK